MYCIYCKCEMDLMESDNYGNYRHYVCMNPFCNAEVVNDERYDLEWTEYEDELDELECRTFNVDDYAWETEEAKLECQRKIDSLDE